MREIFLPDDVDDREAAAKRDLFRQAALDEHYDVVIDEPTCVYRAGDDRPWIVYDRIVLPPIAPLLDRLVWSGGYRSAGMAVRSVGFGFHPAYPLRRQECCGSFALNSRSPDVYAALLDLAETVSAFYREHRPDLYDAQAERVAEVRDDWRMRGPYTSGILNNACALAYHRDAGNFPGTMNAQVVLRRDTTGGLLVMPGLRLAFACDDGSLLLSDAQAVTHGVTRIGRRRRDGYRYSIVYYALRSLVACGSPEEEHRRARRKRTEREDRRAGLIP